MKHLTVGGALILLVCVGATRAEAQGVATSFEQLQVLVKPGDKITVVDRAGREAEGRLGILSRERLTLVTPAGPRELGALDVTEVRKRRDDSLRNGAIIGAAAGTGYGVAMLALSMAISDGGDPIPASIVTGMIIFAGVGAAAGAGIDALITRRQVIYQQPAGGSRLTISPLIDGRRRGAQVSIRF